MDTKRQLADMLVCACARVWEDDDAVLASGMGVIQRLGASLAMLKNPRLMMTDAEAYLVSEPVPLGARGDYQPQYESWMGFSRVFECLWSGARHALIGPSQVDRFGQANISAIGDYAKPKVQLLGMRGLPGNSISHANSFFVPAHSKRVFVAGEVDTVCSIGYNQQRLPRGYSFADIDIRFIVSNLCVMDFDPTSKRPRLVSLHRGVTVDEVIANTGFELIVPRQLPTTAAASPSEREAIARLDPHQLRLQAF